MPRPAREPNHTRGKKIMRHLKKRGVTATEAARLAGVGFKLLYDVIHLEPPPTITDDSIAKLTGEELELPRELVAPGR